MYGLSLSLLLLVPGVLSEPLRGLPVEKRQSDSYRTLTTASNPDWMMTVSDGASLGALSIPGTHESLALVGGDITECQENLGTSADTLTAQLSAGIRMFDIRLRIESGNTFVVHHGAVYQDANFDDVLTKVSAYLSAHPTEAVLMRVKQECTGQIGSCTDVSGQASFVDIFDMYTARYPNAFWAPSINRNAAPGTPTLGAVRGKIVLAVINGPQGGRTDSYGLAQFSGWNDGDSTYIQDNYNVPDVGAIATKRDQVRRFLDAYNAPGADFGSIFVNFGSGSSLFAFPNQVAGGAFGVQGVNPFVEIYLGQGTDVHQAVKRTGVLMLDFPGGGLINKILTFNAGL
ncbi:unnamed protein product [Mycena citricolor]|uniref:Phosphatidylinositol-specific phospholipase C X domain-containing protein n=1 Tax=Mycena citricolor TaxID=2018698 RepID=A0AAD2HNP8_9AGAR|nr:unnamed protein product [Mycena citricolor]